ncbi:MAG TPA: hypothetical protein VIC57_08115 [Candidatus Dormibacteraeota bacterium]
MIAQRPRPRVNLLGPVLLIGLGVLALLVTTGMVGRDATDRLLSLWPLLLVLLGVQIVVLHLLPGRTGAFVALAAMLAVVAMGVGLVLGLPDAPLATYRPSAPAAGVAAGSLRLDAGRGSTRLSGGDLGGDLYRAEIATTANGGPTVEVAGGSVHLSTHPSPDVLWLGRVASDQVDVTLSSRVPWAVTINGAGLAGQADLSALDVSSVSVNGAGMTVDLRLPPEPSGAVTIAVNGAGSNVTVRIPSGTAAHAVATGLATGLDVDGTAATGGAWRSPGYDAAGGRYEISVAGVGSRVRVETMP